MSFPLPGRILPLFPRTFRALRYRNFRLLWTGQLVSLTGRWAQSVAQGWLVLRLTDSPFYLGLIGFFTFLPIPMFGLIAGAAADRVHRRRALLWTQGLAMALASVLTALTWTDTVRVWHVAALAFGVGVVGAFDIPIRQSLLQDLVGRDDLPNAIALNSLAFNGARLIGPTVGGLLLAGFGEATVFGFNAVTYLAVLAGLAMMRLEPARPDREPVSWLDDIREGLTWVGRTRKARVFLGLVMVSSVFGLPYTILLPVFARDILHAGSSGLGFLTAATGCGAVAGALIIASGVSPGRRGTTVALSMGLLGAALVGFAASRAMALSLLLLFVTGGAMLVHLATSNTLLQLLAPEALRGRIVSFYLLAFMGTAPIGSLATGEIARRWGTPVAVGVGGAVCLATGLAFAAWLPALRRGRPDD